MDGWAWVGEAGEGGGNWGRSHAKFSGCAKRSFLLLTLVFFVVRVCLECVCEGLGPSPAGLKTKQEGHCGRTHTHIPTHRNTPAASFLTLPELRLPSRTLP